MQKYLIIYLMAANQYFHVTRVSDVYLDNLKNYQPNLKNFVALVYSQFHFFPYCDLYFSFVVFKLLFCRCFHEGWAPAPPQPWKRVSGREWMDVLMCFPDQKQS